MGGPRYEFIIDDCIEHKPGTPTYSRFSSLRVHVSKLKISERVSRVSTSALRKITERGKTKIVGFKLVS